MKITKVLDKYDMIEYYKSELSRYRVYELHSGDKIYLNVIAMKELGFNRELKLGENINFPMKAKVIKRYTHKKYPNKKWWQFWIKQEEYIDGYNLIII